MFDIYLFRFSKKANSTARPGEEDESELQQVVLKEGTTVHNPVFLLDLQRPVHWNYAYVPGYGRYYFIVSVRPTHNAIVEIACVTDILATWKSYIGSSRQYVLRSSYTYLGGIIDTMFPVTTRCTTHTEIGLSPWIHTSDSDNISITQGCFIVGYVTKNTPNSDHMYGSVIYSAIEQDDLNDLVQELLDDDLLEDNGFELNDASLALQKSIVDPLSYIKSVIWVPILYSSISGSSLSSLNIWDWSISVHHKILSNNPPYIQYAAGNIALTKHPQTLDKGVWTNVAPYTRINLDYPPFGNIELDTTLTSNANNISGYVLIDLVTGMGTLKLLIDGVEQGLYHAQVGVPIQLSQVSKDYMGATMGAGSGLIGTAAGLMSGNIAGAVSSAFSGIGDAAHSMLSRHSSAGGAGSFAGLYGRPRLYHQFMEIADGDNDHRGRPLCRVEQLSNVPGFIQVLDGEISIPGFEGEAEAIKEYMEAGFFYE